MHELSLAGGILRVVEDAAERETFTRVSLLRLEAGALSGVDVHALRFALESMVHDTYLQDARIEIDEPPGQAWCLPCGQTVSLAQRGDPCPSCGHYQLQATGGTELKVLDMRVV